MAETFNQIAQRVIFAIGEVEGTSVQTYSEPRVKEALKQIFYTVIRKLWWPQYMKWHTKVLDGTIGILTTDFDPVVQDVRDLRAILYENTQKAIPLLPLERPPSLLTGSRPLYYESLNSADANFTTRLLQFWPAAATGTIHIHARHVPTLVDATEIFLQSELLIFGASWLILETEDVNPNAAGLMERMFGETYSNILKSYADQPIENPNWAVDNQRYLTEWFGSP